MRATGTLILTATVAGYASAPGPGSLETLASASGCRNQLATCFRSHAMPCFLSKRMRKLAAAEEALAESPPACHRKQQILVIRNRRHTADSSFTVWYPQCHTPVVGLVILIPTVCRARAPSCVTFFFKLRAAAAGGHEAARAWRALDAPRRAADPLLGRVRGGHRERAELAGEDRTEWRWGCHRSRTRSPR